MSPLLRQELGLAGLATPPRELEGLSPSQLQWPQGLAGLASPLGQEGQGLAGLASPLRQEGLASPQEELASAPRVEEVPSLDHPVLPPPTLMDPRQPCPQLLLDQLAAGEVAAEAEAAVGAPSQPLPRVLRCSPPLVDLAIRQSPLQRSLTSPKTHRQQPRTAELVAVERHRSMPSAATHSQLCRRQSLGALADGHRRVLLLRGQYPPRQRLNFAVNHRVAEALEPVLVA